MKLPDFTRDEPLNSLRRVMGAPLGDYSSHVQHTRLTMRELESLMGGGIDVDSDQVRVLDDGTLAYKDSRVLLYIRDVQMHNNHKSDLETLPRFHVSNCRTLQDMRAKNRWARYVVATRNDGYFSINKILGERRINNEMLRLVVCQNCLEGLHFDSFSYSAMGKATRRRVVSQFTIDRFFALYAKSLFIEVPEHDGDSAPVNDYPADFHVLALKVKERAGWRCCKCGLALDEDRRFLHVHHKNGQKYDSNLENLEALCLGCHAIEPLHAHMRNLPEYRAFTARFGAR